MIPFETIIELCSYAFEPYGSSSWYQYAPPTAESVKLISEELHLVIPDDFIMLARRCPNYGGWFASIGEDYDNPIHILNVNKQFHEEGLPSHFVILNHGHDGDCDCWDKRTVSDKGEHPITYIHVDEHSVREKRDYIFYSFRDYLENFSRTHSVRTSVRKLRRKAKRILAEFDEGSGANQ